MKTLLLTWIVLFGGALEVLSSPIRAKRSDAQEIEKLTGLLNAMRQEVGQEIGAQMQVLVHDAGLDGIAGGLPGDCNNWKHGQGHRLTPVMMDENGLKMWAVYLALLIHPDALDKINAEAKTKVTKEQLLKEGTLFAFEYFHPDQNKIGCAQVSCVGKLPDELVPLFQFDTYQFYGACVLGPNNGFDKVGDVAKSQTVKGKMDQIGKEQKVAHEDPRSGGSQTVAKFLFSMSLVLIISLF